MRNWLDRTNEQEYLFCEQRLYCVDCSVYSTVTHFKYEVHKFRAKLICSAIKIAMCTTRECYTWWSGGWDRYHCTAVATTSLLCTSIDWGWVLQTGVQSCHINTGLSTWYSYSEWHWCLSSPIPLRDWLRLQYDSVVTEKAFGINEWNFIPSHSYSSAVDATNSDILNGRRCWGGKTTLVEDLLRLVHNRLPPSSVKNVVLREVYNPEWVTTVIVRMYGVKGPGKSE